MKKIIFLIITSFFLIGCLTNHDEMTLQEQREYWREKDPELAEQLDLMDSMYATKERKLKELNNSMSYMASLQKTVEVEEENLNVLVNQYNDLCKNFVRLLNYKQISYYSLWVDAEKEENLPKSTLYSRKLYKSLSEGSVKELKNLLTLSDEINVKSREIIAHEKDIALENELSIAIAKELDRIDGDIYKVATLVGYQSSPPTTSSIEPIVKSLKEWEQNIHQRRIEYKQNYHMMQRNNDLNKIASSINNIDSIWKYSN